ncbi:DUF934 domain-containing protein [Kordiimonas pumila]|uniref:DUF934 domain-containing protein n=1 Tax=Kordiimonas pumila TaxID=2161677 RepID=A0ABV7D6G6_9PROT|nr:DUF934 domain-containing protein [Kordiimonas pumila]
MVLLSLNKKTPGNWTLVSDVETIPATGAIAVPVAALTADNNSLLNREGGIGVIVSTDTSYTELAPLVEKAAFFAVTFPGFGDGRGFSLAVRLRKDLGFKGEIRAVGPVIPDQAMHLMRAGFDSVEVTDARKDAFEKALHRYQDFYQADFIGTNSVAHVRHGAPAERKTS